MSAAGLERRTTEESIEGLLDARPWYSPLPWWTKSDIDGMMTMLSQNLASMLIAAKLLHVTLSKSSEDVADDIVYRRMLPGMGVAMCFGCCYYAAQAQLLARAERRSDLCAQPFGISTPGIFVFASSIIAPAYELCGGNAKRTWDIACLANLIQGMVEVVCCFLGPYAVNVVSIGALLTALANIGFSFLLTEPLQGLAAAPLVAMLPLVLLLLAQLSDVRVPKLPTAIMPILVATALGWGTGHLKASKVSQDCFILGLHVPRLNLDMFSCFGEAMRHIGIILPVALTNAIGTLQCQQMAETAGDAYGVRASMLGDGIATGLAALLGCPYGFTVYIGHPALKQMGCKVGYNLATGFFVLLVTCSGAAAVILSLVPVEGLSSFVIFVGLVVSVDALKVLPNRHWVAFMVGLVPGVCSWAAAQARNFTSSVWPKGIPIPDLTDPTMWDKDPTGAMKGLSALGNGYILSSMCLCSIVMALVDRKFLVAAAWCLTSSLLSAVGLIHSSQMFLPWTHGLGSLSWQFAGAYGVCGLTFLLLTGLQARGRLPRGPVDIDFAEPPAEDNELFASVLGQRYFPADKAGIATNFRRSYP